MNDVLERIANIGIVPVVKINDAKDALPLARSLYNGGIDVAEITFRSEHAASAIKTISEQLPDMLVGAGTVLTVEQAKLAKEAGARFIITPGFNQTVVDWCLANDIPVMPGVSTASEIELALACGLHHLKFFPAESSGGAKKLKDLSAPYAQVKFIPTGGINAKNMHDYLSLPNVLAIGGSFMLPAKEVEDKNWEKIEELSKEAVKTMLAYELIHIGINEDSSDNAYKTAETLCKLFNFKYYKKPRSHFAGRGFEILNAPGPGRCGHIGIYTPYPQRAIYHLAKAGIQHKSETITRNKKTQAINFVYLDLELSGFAIHLINPDVKM